MAWLETFFFFFRDKQYAKICLWKHLRWGIHNIDSYLISTILNKNDHRCWYPKQNLCVRPQPLPACPVVLSCVLSLPTVSPYNSSSVPGWMSVHTRRHTSTHSPTHTSPQAHCTATFCWAPLRTWQANLGGKHKYKQRERRYAESKHVVLHVYVYLLSMQFRVFVFHWMRIMRTMAVFIPVGQRLQRFTT